jgi:hypothetical protein
MLTLTAIPKSCTAQTGKGMLTLHFINTANGKPVSKGDAMYYNAAGDDYTVTKLKYYVSLFRLDGKDTGIEEPYYLIDEGRRNKISIPVPAGEYRSLQFLLGIDSMRHCSGAQSGDLDPLMDMFWTWNSGYVIFKLEGYSSRSIKEGGRLEHHIGGYKAGNAVSTEIDLAFENKLIINEGEQKEITMEMNLDKYWNSSVDISTADMAIITKPGSEAVRISKNFRNLFRIIPAE